MISSRSATAGVLHQALRAATRNDHLQLDRMILRLDLSRREDYGLFLHLHHTAMLNLAANWRREDHEDFGGMTRCLLHDLQNLGMPSVALIAPSRATLTGEHQLGVAYVIRGSRLGATFLRRRVPEHYPASYFDFEPTIDWPQFLETLHRTSDDPDSPASHDVIGGARITFQLFDNLLAQALA